MSPLHSTHTATEDRRNAYRPLAPGPVAAPFDDEGLYVTDEAFLFRVLGVVDTDAGEMVELEDAYALDVVRVAIDDPRLLGLRVVMALPCDG